MRHAFTVTLLGAVVLLLTTAGITSAQTPPPAAIVTHPASAAESPPLSSLPTARLKQSPADLNLVPPAKPLPQRAPGPGGPKSDVQGQPGPHSGVQPKLKFGGIGANGFIPPDPNIAVGKNTACMGVGCIVQVVNSQIAVFNKVGTQVMAPVSLSSLWSSLPGGGGCASNNAGDPVVQYDAAVDRWLVTQLGSTSGPTYSECIAVSKTSDPTGAYFLYSYDFGTNLNDYPKFGVWPTATNSAYLASYNLFANGQTPAGSALCAYDRGKLLAGAAQPASLCLTLPNDAGFLPADLDGSTPPPDGTPGYFLNLETLSSLRLYQLSPDFTNLTLTFTTADISVSPFNFACGGGNCVVQPNGQKLDSLGDRLMYRLAYRVFGDHTSMVVNHSVAVPGATVGVRWYELRKSAIQSSQCDSSQFSGTTFYLCQQGTFAPDTAYRWMGSTGMDGAGNIAFGYSKSSAGIYPAIAFTGRTPTTPTGTMGTETVLQAGAGAQTNFSRWGDYTSLRIDPYDDTTFWYTNEYYTHNSQIFNYLWSTAIGSFTVGASNPAADFTINVSPTSLTATRRGSGSSVSATVTIVAINAASTVTLSITGVPAGTSASFSPNPVTASGTSTLTIKAGAKSPTGSFPLTIIGGNGSATHQTALTLTIQ